MDDTIEDLGIPFLQNGEDIPVHSTPIKGEKVPLPSTRHVSKFLQQKSQRHIDDATSESIQSVRSSDAMEFKGQRAKVHGGDLRTSLESSKQIRPDSHQQLYPQPDKLLDISNQDNLRPKLREHTNYSHHFRQEEMKLDKSEKYLDEKPSTSSLRTSYATYSISQYGKEKTTSNSQSKSSLETPSVSDYTLNNQSKASLQTPSTNDNGNAFSSYRRYLRQDGKVSVNDSAGASFSVKISTHNTDNETESLVRGNGPEEQNVTVKAVTKTSINDKNGPVTDRKHFTLSSPKYLSRYDKQNASFTELENATIAKQRQEVQLLISELKDRDRELSDMMSSHQQQLIAWEQDRMRLTSLEKKSRQLEDDLQTKSSQLRNAVVTLKAVKSRETDNRAELEKFKTAINNLNSEKQTAKEEMEKYRVENIELQKQMEDISGQLGYLQARETELTTNIKAKEKDISYATSQMKELSLRLQQLDLRCKECQDREKEALREKDRWKNAYENSLLEIQKLTEELNLTKSQCTRMMEENRSARNQLSLVQKEAAERERCKDDVIDSMRVKQERTDTQLKSLRELYERQLKELSHLQLQLDTSKEIIQKQQTSMDQIQLSQSDRSSDLTPERSRAKQRLTFSPQTRLSHNNKVREPDSSHYTQSSGYQSQLSDNQTGINAGSQFVSSGLSSDTKNTEPAPPTMIYGENSLNAENQQSLNLSGTVSHDIQSPRTAHEEYIWHRSVESNSKENRSHSFDEKANQYGETKNDHHRSPLRDRIHTPSPHRQNRTGSFSESSSSKLVIKQTTISVYPNDDSQNDKLIVNGNTGSEYNKARADDSTMGAESDNMVINSEESLAPEGSPDFEKEFEFENKLRSFLEDIDIDIDDSIWEDNQDRTQSISGVDCSPSTKLQKLLLESRLMIENLGKSTEVPIQKFQTGDDTLEKPTFNETNTGEET